MQLPGGRLLQVVTRGVGQLRLRLAQLADVIEEGVLLVTHGAIPLVIGRHVLLMQLGALLFGGEQDVPGQRRHLLIGGVDHLTHPLFNLHRIVRIFDAVTTHATTVVAAGKGADGGGVLGVVTGLDDRGRIQTADGGGVGTILGTREGRPTAPVLLGQGGIVIALLAGERLIFGLVTLLAGDIGGHLHAGNQYH
ncbi:hypothetical protein D3C85_1106400 [compost metagenome]